MEVPEKPIGRGLKHLHLTIVPQPETLGSVGPHMVIKTRCGYLTFGHSGGVTAGCDFSFCLPNDYHCLSGSCHVSGVSLVKCWLQPVLI